MNRQMELCVLDSIITKEYELELLKFSKKSRAYEYKVYQLYSWTLLFNKIMRSSAEKTIYGFINYCWQKERNERCTFKFGTDRYNICSSLMELYEHAFYIYTTCIIKR